MKFKRTCFVALSLPCSSKSPTHVVVWPVTSGPPGRVSRQLLTSRRSVTAAPACPGHQPLPTSVPESHCAPDSGSCSWPGPSPLPWILWGSGGKGTLLFLLWCPQPQPPSDPFLYCQPGSPEQVIQFFVFSFRPWKMGIKREATTEGLPGTVSALPCAGHLCIPPL